MVSEFQMSRLPELHTGEGCHRKLPELILRYGPRVLILSGHKSFVTSVYADELFAVLNEKNIVFSLEEVASEPSPSLVNGIVSRHRNPFPDVIAAIGGGSVLDAGKAVSAMIPSGKEVSLFLEGVGNEKHDGRKIPFIAIPTTAGTGSEATKNAVLSEVGEKGFKRSLRHDQFIPDVALLDPLLSASCPATISVTSGLDALTQLMEAWFSTCANFISDSLALPAIRLMVDNLPLVLQKESDLQVRQNLALGAYLSGVCLANAGLGLVHGLASAIGSLRTIPHGVICASLLSPCHAAGYRKLVNSGDPYQRLRRFETLAAVFSYPLKLSAETPFDIALDAWMQHFRLPGLTAYGLGVTELMKLAENADHKYNPVSFEPGEISNILKQAM